MRKKLPRNGDKGGHKGNPFDYDKELGTSYLYLAAETCTTLRSGEKTRKAGSTRLWAQARNPNYLEVWQEDHKFKAS